MTEFQVAIIPKDSDISLITEFKFGVRFMNKIVTALCLSSAVFACAPSQAAWQGSWVVGASGGLVHDRGELTVTDVSDGRQTVVVPRFQDEGWFLGLFGGYQWLCNRWLLGLELNLDWYDNDSDDNNFAYTSSDNTAWNVHSEYDREWVVGLSGRMGYEIATYLLPYVRVGLEYSDDDLHYAQTINNSNPVFRNAADASQDSVRLFGGMGLEVPVPKFNCLTLRFEYDYHTKGKRVEAVNNITDAQGSDIVSASRKPYTQTVFASVVWNIRR